jgi:Tfp pilus assembly protein PilN
LILTGVNVAMAATEILSFIRDETLLFISDQFDLIRVILVGVLLSSLVWLLVRLHTNSFHHAIYSSLATMLGEIQRHSLELNQRIDGISARLDAQSTTIRGAYELNQKIDGISSRLDTQTTVISEVYKELHQLHGDNISLLTLASENDALASERFQRVLPVSCYASIDDPKVTGAVEEAVVNLMEAIGFYPVYDWPPQLGAWFKRIWVQAKDQLSKPEVQDRLAKLGTSVEMAMEPKHIDNPQATVDLELSKAALNFKKALHNVSEGAISAGSFFVVKTTAADGKSRLVALSLNQEQMELVKSNPKMQTDPMTFLTILENSKKPSLTSQSDFGVTQPLGATVSSPIITPSGILTDRALNPPPTTKRGRRRPKGESLSEEQ